MAPHAYTARAQVVLTRIDRGEQVGGEPRGGAVFLHHINQRFPALGSWCRMLAYRQYCEGFLLTRRTAVVQGSRSEGPDSQTIAPVGYIGNWLTHPTLANA